MISKSIHGETIAWWRHQMETLSALLPLTALLALCAGISPVTGEFPTQRPVTWSFDVFSEICLNKRSSKQSWGCSFETQLWCHCNDVLGGENVDVACNYTQDDTCMTNSEPRVLGICLGIIYLYYSWLSRRRKAPIKFHKQRNNK